MAVSILATIFLVTLLQTASAANGAPEADNGWSDTMVTIEWNTTYQTMKGFGTFVGSANFIYGNPNREQFFDLLFGDNGLKLTVIRSTLPAVNWTMSKNENCELWIQKRVKQKQGVSMFMASAWSPPYQWKSRKGQSTGEHMNMLLEAHYADYAKFITDYVEFRNKIGLSLYAVSPQNEPEYATTDWDGCVWFPQQTAKFVRNHLKPIFNRRNISTKIMIGENANWNVGNLYLSSASLMLRNEDFDVYASHGYSMPEYPKLTVTYNQHVIPWIKKLLYKKDRWITEASSTEQFDASMKKGIQLAVSLSRFLTEGNINGYIFWNGVIEGESNEGLISANQTGKYVLPRVYHVYGHFSRHIKPGYIRIKASKSFFPLESDLEVVALKDSKAKAFTVVVTNYSNSKNKKCILRFKDTEVDTKSIEAIKTDEHKEWASVSYNIIGNNAISLTISPMSVITVTGTVRSHYHSTNVI